MKILGFQKYNEINSSRIRIKSKKIDGDEIIYETHLTINGEGIELGGTFGSTFFRGLGGREEGPSPFL